MTNTQITTASNLVGPDLAGSQTNAKKFFTNLYSVDFGVSPEVNDTYNAFFEKYTGSKSAGNQMAATVLYSAIAQGLNPLAVLNDFQQLPKGQIDTYLAAFLNVNRVPTSSIGIKNPVTVNPFISRTILP